MPTVKNVAFLLDPKAASRLATTNKNTRALGRLRMSSPEAKKARSNAVTLGKLYRNLERLGLVSHFPNRRENLNNFLKVYLAEQKRTVSRKKTRSLKPVLFNNVHRRIRNNNRRRMMEIENNTRSQGSTPNY